MRYNRKSVEVITPAASFPITLAELKSHLRIDGSDDDTALNIFIAAATDSVEQYLGRKLINTTLALHIDGFNAIDDEKLIALGAGTHDGYMGDYVRGVEYVSLPYIPASSITSIKTYDTANSESVLSSAAYRLDGQTGRVYLNNGYTWPSSLRDYDAVLVTYVAGYGATASAIPALIKNAVLIFAASMYECRGACDMQPACKNMLSSYRVFDGMGWM